ncbi:MAG: hypothetical protein WC468_02280 [Candidatus Paceibacterota bacterium]
MKKSYLFSILFLIFLTIGSCIYQYVETFKTEITAATQTIPNPGHSWSQMESGPDSIQVSGRTITNLAAPVNSTDATNKAYVDAASGASCPSNYGNLCMNGGGLSFAYNGKTMYIDAFPRAAAWVTSGSPTGQALAWQMCGAIGARLPTLTEWQAACSALGGPNGNGMTTFGGANHSSRYEWTATPATAASYNAVLAGGASCSGTTELYVTDSGNSYWFRCVR